MYKEALVILLNNSMVNVEGGKPRAVIIRVHPSFFFSLDHKRLRLESVWTRSVIINGLRVNPVLPR